MIGEEASRQDDVVADLRREKAEALVTSIREFIDSMPAIEFSRWLAHRMYDDTCDLIREAADMGVDLLS